MAAAAIPFPQLEKMIQEKTLYNRLISEYFDKEALDIAGQGFWLKPAIFVLEIFVGREMSIPVCKSLATLVGHKYNQVVTTNSRQESAGWSFSRVGPEL